MPTAKKDGGASAVMSGARAVFSIGGVQIAYASNVSFNESIQLEPVNTLDDLSTKEWVEVGYAVDLNCQNFRVSGNSVKNLGIMPRFDEILTQGELLVTITDPTSGSTLLRMEGVKLESRSTSVDARGLMSETWSFKGRKSHDESEK